MLDIATVFTVNAKTVACVVLKLSAAAMAVKFAFAAVTKAFFAVTLSANPVLVAPAATRATFALAVTSRPSAVVTSASVVIAAAS